MVEAVDILRQLFESADLLRYLDGADVANLRFTCKSLSVSPFVHPLFSAWMAIPPRSRTRRVAHNLPRDLRGLSKSWTNGVKRRSDDFRMTEAEELSQGSYSTVYVAQEKCTGCFFALKHIPKLQASRLEHVSSAVLQEKLVLSQCRHPHVLRLFGTFMTVESLVFVFEYCPHGDLVDVLKRQPLERLPLAFCRRVMSQLLDAMLYIHSLGFIHRDIKPENIFVASTRHVRLGDLGSSISYHEAVVGKTPFSGTVQYLPPETIQSNVVRYESDYWAVGVALYRCLVGNLPYEGGSDYLVMQSVLETHIQVPDWVDPLASESIYALLQKQRSQRELGPLRRFCGKK